MESTAKPEWVKTNDYYNREVVKCDVYSKKISKKRTVYLQDGNNFMFTFSCGAYSDYSYSGSFYNTTIETVEQAKEFLDKIIPLHFSLTQESRQKHKELYSQIRKED